MLATSISKNSLLLGAFALVTAGILAGTQQGTKERIAVEERKAAQKALLEIVPLERHTNDILMDTVAVPHEHWETLGLKSGGEVNIARDQGMPVAAIIPAVAPDGYSGDIRLIVGVNIDGTLAGVRILSHTETPGLGDKVDLKKSDWVLGFNGRSLANPAIDDWKVKKDGGEFDQFTGATITPRAVVKRVKNTLMFFQQARATLFPEPAPEGTDTPATGADANSKTNLTVTPETNTGSEA